ncbi:MAG: carbon-nitrogen hydrolase family protein [Bacillota bacterium]|nr:carbon-nitrogen hydrolase family protein [Bacillota bacterium]
MKITLAAVEQREDMRFAIDQIRRLAEQEAAKGTSLLLFPEAFFQGFEGLNFNYEHDLSVVVSERGTEINEIRRICREAGIAIGFGYYEMSGGVFYDSYLVLNSAGETLANYRRRNAGWKEPHANADYREGKEFTTFEFGGYRFGIVICGDMFSDEHLTGIAAVECDCMLWPVYVDYQKEQWEEEYPEYLKQTAILGMPVAFVNAYVDDSVSEHKWPRAKGGAFVAHLGKPLYELPIDAPGTLTFDLSCISGK